MAPKTQSKWAAVLVALRSYMADVSGRQHWSPIHDPLHYALIAGNDGEKRWHLIHPDAMPLIQPLVDSGKATLHDRLGGDVSSGSKLKFSHSFRANRVPAVVGEHPELGKVLVKGGEQHTDHPFHSVNDSNATSWTEQNDKLNDWGDDSQLFGQNAEFVTDAGRAMGAPMVPLRQGYIGSLKDEANEAHDPDQKFFYHPDQYASFQPFIHPVQEAKDNLKGLIPAPSEPSYKKEDREWMERLDSRLKTAEHITGAPDCHSGNYVDVPTILSTGHVSFVPHGIDYEWAPGDGFLSGSTSELHELADDTVNEIFSDNNHEGEDETDWIDDDTYVHPIQLGQLDVYNSLHRSGTDPYGGDTGGEESDMVQNPHDYDEFSPLPRAGHVIKKLGNRVRTLKPWHEDGDTY